MEKVCVITGAGSGGIGAAIARELAAEDQITLLHDLEKNLAGLEELKNKLPGKVLVMTADFSLMDQVTEFAKKVKESLKRVDILVNNAGVALDGPFTFQPWKQMELTNAINLLAPLRLCKEFSRLMIAQKYGRIINMASVVGQMGNANQVAYASSKAGLIGATKSLAKELSLPSYGNITVNAVAPGFIATAMTDNLPAEVKTWYIERIPMKRGGSPEEVAKAVKFLTSDDAAYITGAVIPVNGGLF
jgi:3-oxoacyl-[acyl-carrier protein] reductase